MNIGSNLQFTIPNTCPSNCKHKSIEKFNSCSACLICPIFLCNDRINIINKTNYRDDWAEKWEKFFLGECDLNVEFLDKEKN